MFWDSALNHSKCYLMSNYTIQSFESELSRFQNFSEILQGRVVLELYILKLMARIGGKEIFRGGF